MSSKQRWVLALTGVASAMAVLDALVVSTALSTARPDLHASLARLQWTVNGYALSFAVLLMPVGTPGDRFGRRRTPRPEGHAVDSAHTTQEASR
jgi:MFS family permease